MTDALFDIVFRGDILPGYQLIEVKQRLGQLFKIDDAKVHSLFTSGVVPLKRNLSQADAEKYRLVLAKIGVSVQVAPAGSVKPRSPRPVRASVASSSPAPASSNAPVPPASVSKPSVPAASVPRQTLAERLAANQKNQAADNLFLRSEPTMQVAEVDEDEPESDSAGPADAVQAGLSLAAVGTDVLADSERPSVAPVSVDVSGLSVRAQEGELLDANERQVIAPVEVSVGDYGLTDVGADLLQDDEKTLMPAVEVVLADWDIAPAGSDLEELKQEKTPVNPDISGLSLSDDD